MELIAGIRENLEKFGGKSVIFSPIPYKRYLFNSAKITSEEFVEVSGVDTRTTARVKYNLGKCDVELQEMVYQTILATPLEQVESFSDAPESLIRVPVLFSANVSVEENDNEIGHFAVEESGDEYLVKYYSRFSGEPALINAFANNNEKSLVADELTGLAKATVELVEKLMELQTKDADDEDDN